VALVAAAAVDLEAAVLEASGAAAAEAAAPAVVGKTGIHTSLIKLIAGTTIYKTRKPFQDWFETAFLRLIKNYSPLQAVGSSVLLQLC
jgi:hypothetical protein